MPLTKASVPITSKPSVFFVREKPRHPALIYINEKLSGEL